MRLQPIAFARARNCAAAASFRAPNARVDATSIGEADLQSTQRARPTIVVLGWAVGVSAESAK
jgi:hypothetical protein